METRRVLLAIVLMIAVIVLTQLLFPPAPPADRTAGSGADAAAVDTPRADTAARAAASDTPAGEAAAGGDGGEAGEPPAPSEGDREFGRAPAGEQEAAPEDGLFEGPEGAEEPGDSVTVSTPLYRVRFSTRGAAVTGVELRRYDSHAEGEEGQPVRLVREGDRLLAWRVTDGRDTLDLRTRSFEPSRTRLEVEEGGEARTLTFRHRLPEAGGLAYVVTYRFEPDSYRVAVEGRLEGLGQRGYTILASMGRGLRTNEANPDEDYDQLAFAVNSGGGEIETQKLDDIGAGETRTPEGGPFRWVSVKNKYFLISYVAPEGTRGFGGLTARGVEAEHAAEMEASYPVPADEEGFRFLAYMGPQEYERLQATGQSLHNVNPYGWEWLRFLIRPLVSLIMTIFTWAHTTLGLAYGWVLILFGIAMRVVLFPLYQKSMRAQMAQMQVQPLVKELQEKYDDEPEKLQKEMMRLYKEHDINPLAGCLPMLLPFPILITLFFVFQNTIEVRGVSFWWIPDLSLHDPLYITPLVMGASMFLLQWIGQRGMERNTQMKIMGYAMPVVFFFLFLRFPAGLNLYYATSNLASLPQQWYLSLERKEMQEKGELPGTGDD